MQNDALLKDLAHCGSPDTLVAAILKHHPGLQAPVDVEDLARSMGISAFRAIHADGSTSGLLTDVETGEVIILTAATFSSPRRRIAIAHQLGHHLMTVHVGDRQCASRDLSESRRDTPRRKEEMQANRFAAGLLMPKPLFVAFVAGLGKPSVAHLPKIAATYGVTVKAAADRYVELAKGLFAVLLIKKGIVRHVMTGRSFPPLCVRPGDAAPATAQIASSDGPIAWTPVEVRDWLVMAREVRPPAMAMQMLDTRSGVKIVLLSINAAGERRADEEAEKAATESPKFGRRPSR
jgi:Zn-dependent peptidase ImmA (M78 family)